MSLTYVDLHGEDSTKIKHEEQHLLQHNDVNEQISTSISYF